MPKLPDKITLNLDTEKLYVDGEEFPWYIAEGAVEVTGLMDPHTIPMATVSFFAETIEVIPQRPTRRVECMVPDGADPIDHFDATFPDVERVKRPEIFQKPDGTRWIRYDVIDTRTTETTTK
jgi:hypothetical protein